MSHETPNTPHRLSFLSESKYRLPKCAVCLIDSAIYVENAEQRTAHALAANCLSKQLSASKDRQEQLHETQLKAMPSVKAASSTRRAKRQSHTR
jgi:hypothetical protein